MANSRGDIQDGTGQRNMLPAVGFLRSFGAGAPTASIAGYAPSAIYQDYTNGIAYLNTGNNASATWSRIAAAGSTLATLTVTALTVTNAAITNAAVSNMTMADGGNIITNATTGTQLGTANTQKVGFWGATPIIQPSANGTAVGAAGLISNANASSIYVTNASNFNGNSGNSVYTIGDIVRHLKLAGILQS